MLQFILGTLIVVVLSLCWYMPVYKKAAGPDRVDKKTLRNTFFVGLVPTFIVAFFIQMGIAFIYNHVGLEEGSAVRVIITAFVSYALVEESAKMFFGSIMVKRLKEVNAKNYILVFGMIGIGFEIFESMMLVGMAGIIGAILRGVLALHVICQIWMGGYCYRAYKCKENADRAGYRKNMILALLIPVLVHGFHDSCSAAGILTEGMGSTGTVVTVIVYGLAAVFDLLLAFGGFRNAFKAIAGKAE